MSRPSPRAATMKSLILALGVGLATHRVRRHCIRTRWRPHGGGGHGGGFHGGGYHGGGESFYRGGGGYYGGYNRGYYGLGMGGFGGYGLNYGYPYPWVTGIRDTGIRVTGMAIEAGFSGGGSAKFTWRMQ